MACRVDEEAVQAVIDGTMGYKKTAQQLKVVRYVAKAIRDVGSTFTIAQLRSVRNGFTEARDKLSDRN